jgi:hypothetical protein
MNSITKEKYVHIKEDVYNHTPHQSVLSSESSICTSENFALHILEQIKHDFGVNPCPKHPFCYNHCG